MPNTILSIADQKYCKYLKTLISSIAVNFKDVHVHLHLINVSPSEQDELLCLYSNITFTSEEVKIDDSQSFSAYCANVRVRVMRRLLESGIDNLLYLDADSIVRKDLTPLFRLLKNTDLIIHHRHSDVEAWRFATGAIAIRNNAKVKVFMQGWEKNLESLIYSWYGDQISFSRTYEILKNELYIKNLPMKYIDWKFSPFSSIWAGKGKRKHENMLYLLEDRIYELKALSSHISVEIIKISIKQMILQIQNIIFLLLESVSNNFKDFKNFVQKIFSFLFRNISGALKK
ncbi:MAG: putative nucleotide-diphospho-sugar transferase [Aphanizomenon gracile PMC644.10]|nr:putative nucleotide-diphospho-sugar transferase [Aphanizomenon gracile PMC644.10]